MYKVPEVSRSGYYGWWRRPQSKMSFPISDTTEFLSGLDRCKRGSGGLPIVAGIRKLLNLSEPVRLDLVQQWRYENRRVEPS